MLTQLFASAEEVVTETATKPGIVTNWFALFVSIVIVASFIVLVIMSKKYKFKAIVIAEVGIAAGLSLLLGYFKIFQLPQGGSISLATLPVIIVALRRGLLVGIITGIISGILTMIPDPYFIHPVQVLLDYPMAWGALGFAGLVVEKENKKALFWSVGILLLLFIGFFLYGMTTNVVSSWFGNNVLEGATLGWDSYVFIGIILAFLVPAFFIFKDGLMGKIGAVCLGSFGRFFFHFLSGVFFFWMFIEYWPGYSLFGYVAIYNALHIIPETIITILMLPLLGRVLKKSAV